MSAPAADHSGPRGLDLVVDRLACPLCRTDLHRDAASLGCTHGHAFDIARQGYVSLLPGGRRANTADSAEMVAARDRFLAGGHYAPIAETLVGAVPEGMQGLCVDVAGGTGYYLGAVLDARPRTVGLTVDLSAPALRRAARVHRRAAAIAADAWAALPLRDGSASLAMSVFGPRNGADLARVLRPDGLLAVVMPTPRHLAEIIGPLDLISVGTDKSERLDRRLAGFERLSVDPCEYLVRLEPHEVEDLVLMGPSAHHLDRSELAARIERLPIPTPVTVSVEVSLHGLRRATDDGSHNG